MTDWIFYSPKLKFASAGDLLRAIPSNRIWRLERSFVEDGRDTLEMVRAAEQLLDLDVTLRLQNDPAAALQLRVVEPTDDDRRAFSKLGRAPFVTRELAVVARLNLSKSAERAGHLDISDDVLAGLDVLFSGGIAHCPSTGELIEARQLRALLDNVHVRCSHLDLELRCDGAQREYVTRQLLELPPPFGQYLRTEQDTLLLRARFPTTLDEGQIDAVCAVAVDMARYANAGHVRFRQRGMWRHAVENVGQEVASPPGSGGGVLDRLSRLIGDSK